MLPEGRHACAAKSAAIYLRICAIHLANLQFIAFPVQSKNADITFSSTGHSGLSIGEHHEHYHSHSPRRTDDFDRNHSGVARDHVVEL
jgi:hypothetical protein